MTKQKTILITGCSSGGIGHCVAHGLKARGYRVFATARKAEDVDALQEEGFESFHLDHTDSASMQNTVTQVLEKTGGELYALFNNGAYGQPGALEDVSRQALRDQFETNVFGWHELTNLVLPVMRKQGYGRIIQHSSVLGIIALKFRGAYNASKYAIEGLGDTLRLELMDTNIFVSMIETGPVQSNFRKNSFEIYKKTINKENSPFRKQYEAMEARLTKEGAAVPFTLPAEAVLKKVILALESNRPRAHYYVTFPTYLFGYLKRLLPTSLLDKLLNKV
jgi:NAD(P)-dependent dehydrogenase (short-subunit alcohol dehydrogenase family)